MWKGVSVGILFVVLTLGVAAHLDAGEEKIVDGIIVDFGYSPAEPIAGEPIDFSITLLDEARRPIPFTYAWIRIADEDQIVFTSTLSEDLGQAFMTFTAPGGTYKVTSRFFGESGPIVTADFVLPVLPGIWAGHAVETIFALILFFGILFYFRKRFKWKWSKSS